MRRVLFVWRGRRIWSYPACLYVGLNVGMAAQNWAAHIAGASAWHVYAATLALLPVALIGSRLLFVASQWRLFARQPELLWRRSAGGYSMFGGLPPALAASVPLLDAVQVPFWLFWDLSMFCIFAGMACARVGCLLNGCCAGREVRTRWSLYLPNAQGAWTHRHPTQILEGLVALTLLALAFASYPYVAHLPGLLFLLATGAYGLARLGLQTLREDREWLGPVDVQQAISAGLVVFASLGVILIAR
jgi:prolipoprotein diacylglyceryltransferase